MSGALFLDVLDCGCARGLGHSCRPSWMTEKEWRGTTTVGCDKPKGLVTLGEIGGDRNGAGTPSGPLTVNPPTRK